jgi:hypothetical protein
MIDFEKLKDLDMEVINRRHTPEEDRAFSEFLKKRRAEQALLDNSALPRTKKPRPLPSNRKNIRSAAK